MKIIRTERRGGKTTKLLHKLILENGDSIVLCPSIQRAMYCMDRCEEALRYALVDFECNMAEHSIKFLGKKVRFTSFVIIAPYFDLVNDNIFSVIGAPIPGIENTVPFSAYSSHLVLYKEFNELWLTVA